MVDALHTPGPWTVRISGDGNYLNIDAWRRDPRTSWLGHSQCWFNHDRSAEETEANATLIAAAPELLAALREARKALHQHYVDWNGEPEDAVKLQLARTKCDAAIAKATATHSTGEA